MPYSRGKHVAVVIALESDFSVIVIYTHNKLNMKVIFLHRLSFLSCVILSSNGKHVQHG